MMIQKCMMCAAEFNARSDALSCSVCRKIRAREHHRKYRAKNADKIRERSREYFRKYSAKNADKLRENSRRYRARNPDKIRERGYERARKLRKMRGMIATFKQLGLIQPGDFK